MGRWSPLVIGVFVVGLSGCAVKMSEKELVEALERQGLKVAFRTPSQNTFHSERNLALVLSGEEGYSAARFESVAMADEFCRTQKNGVVVNYWCISTWRSGRGEVWPKVKALAGK